MSKEKNLMEVLKSGSFSPTAERRSNLAAGSIWFRSFCLGLVVALGVGGASCASEPRVVDHAFDFDAFGDNWDADLMDYRYGSSAMTRTPQWQKDTNRVKQGGGVNGEIPRGDDLYVKWRLKATGEVIEDTVDLRDKLPRDIKGHTIRFVIRGRQLYVYLISPERRPADWPPIGPAVYQYRKVFTVYPVTSTK
jgi:hypothetical protein